MIAIDTETMLIADRTAVVKENGEFRPTKGGNRTPGIILTGPFEPPELIVVSWCDGIKSGYWMRKNKEQWLDTLLYMLDSEHIIFHNAPFDIGVLIRFGVHRDWFEKALEEGRIHDTVVLDQLLRLATGEFDMPRWPGAEVPKPYPRSLKVLAKEYLKEDMSKDANIRLTYEQFRDSDTLPPDWEAYAVKDAEITYKLYDKLSTSARAISNGTDLSEKIQVQANYVLGKLDTKGIAIDKAEAERLRERFSADVEPLQIELVKAHLGEWLPAPNTRKKTKLPRPKRSKKMRTSEWERFPAGHLQRVVVFKKHIVTETADAKFKLCQNKIRAELQCVLDDHPDYDPPRTPKGALSLDGEWWKDRIPPEYPALKTWCQYMRLQKVLGTYLNLYSKVDQVFPRWRLLVRSGRMAAASPNVLNIPKRKYGLRSLFVPDPGYQFLVADYSTQELVTLSEVIVQQGAWGPLCQSIKDKVDIHRRTAAFLNDIEYDAVTKAQRQAAKAVNFGIPGGLGAKKLREYAENTYGVVWTLDEAKEVRKKYLSIYTDVAAYLRRCSTNLRVALSFVLGSMRLEDVMVDFGLDPNVHSAFDLIQTMNKSADRNIRFLAQKASRQNSVTLPSGRMRRNCRFTEAANTYFQGTASDVTKRAAFLADVRGLDVRLLVHDEIVVQTNNPETEAPILEDCMLKAFVDVCPNMGQYAGVELEVKDRWGKATNADGEAI